MLTWFGRGSRQNRLIYASAGTNPEPCSEDINQIILGVYAFLGEVPYSDVVETLP